MKKLAFLSFLMLWGGMITFAQEKVDESAVETIKKHGLEQSQVMEIAGWMTDV